VVKKTSKLTKALIFRGKAAFNFSTFSQSAFKRIFENSEAFSARLKLLIFCVLKVEKKAFFC
jgi:hypothetical protein